MTVQFYVSRARFFAHVALTMRALRDPAASVYRNKARVTMLRARALKVAS